MKKGKWWVCGQGCRPAARAPLAGHSQRSAPRVSAHLQGNEEHVGKLACLWRAGSVAAASRLPSGCTRARIHQGICGPRKRAVRRARSPRTFSFTPSRICCADCACLRSPRLPACGVQSAWRLRKSSSRMRPTTNGRETPWLAPAGTCCANMLAVLPRPHAMAAWRTESLTTGCAPRPSSVRPGGQQPSTARLTGVTGEPKRRMQRAGGDSRDIDREEIRRHRFLGAGTTYAMALGMALREVVPWVRCKAMCRP